MRTTRPACNAVKQHACQERRACDITQLGCDFDFDFEITASLHAESREPVSANKKLRLDGSLAAVHMEHERDETPSTWTAGMRCVQHYLCMFTFVLTHICTTAPISVHLKTYFTPCWKTSMKRPLSKRHNVQACIAHCVAHRALRGGTGHCYQHSRNAIASVHGCTACNQWNLRMSGPACQCLTCVACAARFRLTRGGAHMNQCGGRPSHEWTVTQDRLVGDGLAVALFVLVAASGPVEAEAPAAPPPAPAKPTPLPALPPIRLA